jgi:phage shock protein C
VDNNQEFTMNEKRLTRLATDRMLFGVCSGIAHYLNVDPVLVRLTFVIAAVLTNGAGVLLYILLALLMPEDAPVVAAKANSFDDEEIIIK